MNQFHDLPTEMRAGHDFDYAAWAPNTTVTLANVRWNSDYRDAVRFNDKAALNSFIDNLSGPTTRIPEMTYHKPGRPIRIDVPYARALKYNYLRASNPAQSFPGSDQARDYYYFITDIEHVAPGTTALYLQLDVWQTFIYETRFGQSFVESGHYGVANMNAFNQFGKDYLTIPEGLDVGGEYQVSKVYSKSIASARGKETDFTSFQIMVLSTVSLTDDPGTVEKPVMNSAKGNTLSNLPNGAEVYIFDSLNEFTSFMDVYSDKPWITQGIISITAVPGNFRVRYGIDTVVKNVNGMKIAEVTGGVVRNIRTKLAPNWREETRQLLPPRYRHLDKLLTYPYTVLELTSHTGTPILIKPESWDNEDGTIIESSHFAQPAPRIQFYPYRYNAAYTSTDEYDDFGLLRDGGEFLDMATGIFNFPTFSLVNNSYMSFMASNQAGIAFQHQAADWSQQRAQTGNQLAFDQASAGMDLSNDLSRQSISAAQRQSNLQNTTAAIGGAMNALNSGLGASTRGPGAMVGAAASSAVGTALSISQNHQAMGISTDLSRGSNASSVANQGYLRDSNKAFADYATTGDYANQVAGIQAKIQDAKLIQPTTSGQVGGDAFLLSTYRWGYDLKVKTMQGASLARVGEYFLRYGYQINRFMFIPESLHCMSHFTYWKLKESYVATGNYPEKFKQTLRGIMEKGVTVWRNPDDIGVTDIGVNKPLGGIAY